MGDMEYFVAQNNNKNKFGCKQDWLKYCPDWSPLCGIKKPKYIEVIIKLNTIILSNNNM